MSRLLLLLVPAWLGAQEPFPSRPPAAEPLRAVQFPPFHELTLPNGIRMVVVENHEQPSLSVSLSFRAGTAYDPAGKEGLATLVAELLTKGTPSRGAEQIAAQIEGVGGSLSAAASEDFLTVAADVLSDHADLAFTLLGDVSRRATFPAEELELARTRFLSALEVELSQPEAVADRVFRKVIYGRHPYARSTSPGAYHAITRQDVVAFAARRLRPSGALLVVAGDITLPQARDLATRTFGSWRGIPAPTPARPALPVHSRTEILLVHRPGSVQANIVVGNPTFLPTDTGYYAARIATQVLGGGADARLFLILREQKSWTYGSYATLKRLAGVGHWEATFEGRTAVTDSALVELLRQIDRIRTEAIPDSELAAAKGFLVGSFPLTVETPRQIAAVVTTARLLGLPADYMQRYRERLSGVTAARARAAARRVYRRSAFTIVVVGDAKELYDKLKVIAPVRLVDIEGKPQDPRALNPPTTTVSFDRTQIVARSDSFQATVQGRPVGYKVNKVQTGPDSLVYTEHTSLGGAIEQQTTVVMGPAFEMRRVDQTGRAQNQATDIHLVYSGGRVKGRATTPQQGGSPRTVDVDTTVASGVIDDNVLDLLVPSLPLEVGKAFNLNVFSSGEGQTKVVRLTVAGPDSITVPAGAFKAFRVNVEGMQVPVMMYVSTETPRRLLMVAPVGFPLLFELVK